MFTFFPCRLTFSLKELSLRSFTLPEWKRLSLTSAALSKESAVDVRAPPSIIRTTCHCHVAVTYTFLTFLQRPELAVYKAKLLGYFSLT